MLHYSTYDSIDSMHHMERSTLKRIENSQVAHSRRNSLSLCVGLHRAASSRLCTSARTAKPLFPCKAPAIYSFISVSDSAQKHHRLLIPSKVLHCLTLSKTPLVYLWFST